MKRIYVCGPTVYSDMHIGNIRPIMTFDIHNRALKALGIEYEFVHNLTDIDDKIIFKAREEGVSEREVAAKYIKMYLNLLTEANIITPDKMPTVTASIDGIIDFIDKLIQKGYAYEQNGDVYFSVEEFNKYGEISNRDLKTMRYEAGAGKRHPGDFALWKKTWDGESWESPWSKGRPGWHTECTYFIHKYFNGHPLDIHGGGIDLLFPHHENENAQFYAMHEKSIALDWKHVGHISMEGEKMSKSLGNVFTAQKFFDKYGADTLRTIFLTTSFSSPIDINEQMLIQAYELTEKFRKVFNRAQAEIIFPNQNQNAVNEVAELLINWNFSKAMRIVNSKIKEFNKTKSSLIALELKGIFELLGFNFSKITISEEDKKLIEVWETYRKNKNYEEADKLRKILQDKDLI